MDNKLYDNFPPNAHYGQSFLFTISNRQLQRRLIKVLGEINQKETSFEELALPTIPNGIVIFEFGIAEMSNFNYLSPAEVAKAVKFLGKVQIRSLDFFCSIRYYRLKGEKRQALKFDYYRLRLVFREDSLEAHVFHERGPRYLSPADLVKLVADRTNHSSSRKILTEAESFEDS